MDALDYSRWVVHMLILALAGRATTSLEGLGEADLLAAVLGDGGVVAFHHVRDGGTSAGGELIEQLRVGGVVRLRDGSSLSTSGGQGLSQVSKVAKGVLGSGSTKRRAWMRACRPVQSS